jgi:hypothetical protein
VPDVPVADLIRSPISLPERRVGKFRIVHRQGQEFDVVSVREALLTGREPSRVKFDKPITVHELREGKDGLWIADVPIEVRQHREALAKMKPSGRVLVGGLGLGIAAAILAEDPAVTSVDVVELSREVAELCNPHHPKVNVIVADIHDFLEAQPKGEYAWNCAFIDTWRGTSEDTWWSEVLPLRRIIGRRFGPWIGQTVYYWAEDIMLGQVGFNLTKNTRVHWYYRECLHLPMTVTGARWFIQQAGTPIWERRYGSCYPVNEFTKED